MGAFGKDGCNFVCPRCAMYDFVRLLVRLPNSYYGNCFAVLKLHSFRKHGTDRLQSCTLADRKTCVLRLTCTWAKLCNLRSSAPYVTIATAQHISNHRATAELRAVPGRCQGLIRAKSDMNERKGRWRRACTYTRAHTHTGYPPILLAGDSHGNGGRNPFSMHTGTAVQIVDESRLVWAVLHKA